jgi:hypothetical protein
MVVSAIVAFSLVVGGLFAKRMLLLSPESFASIAARPFGAFSAIRWCG